MNVYMPGGWVMTRGIAFDVDALRKAESVIPGDEIQV
jgi:hypothetical protein